MCLTLIGHAYTFRGHSMDRPSKVKGYWLANSFGTQERSAFSWLLSTFTGGLSGASAPWPWLHSQAADISMYWLPWKTWSTCEQPKIRAIEKQVELFHSPNSIPLFWVSSCLSSRHTAWMNIRERLLAAGHVETGDAWTLSLDSPLLKGEHHHLNCHWDSLRCFAKCLSLKKTTAQKL